MATRPIQMILFLQLFGLAVAALENADIDGCDGEDCVVLTSSIMQKASVATLDASDFTTNLTNMAMNNEGLQQLETFVLAQAASGNLPETTSKSFESIKTALEELKKAIDGSHKDAEDEVKEAYAVFKRCDDKREEGKTDMSEGGLGQAETEKKASAAHHENCRRNSQLRAFEEVQQSEAQRLHSCTLVADAEKQRPWKDRMVNDDEETIAKRIAEIGYVNWLKEQFEIFQAEIQRAETQYAPLKAECTNHEQQEQNKETILDDKKEECARKQIDFENHACTVIQTDMRDCEDHRKCHKDGKTSYEHFRETAKTSEKNRNLESRMLKRITCYINVLSGSKANNKVDQAAMDKCTKIDGDLKPLEFEDVPAAPGACKSKPLPNSVAFRSEEYGSLPGDAGSVDVSDDVSCQATNDVQAATTQTAGTTTQACVDTPGWHDSYSNSQGCEHYRTNWCTRSFQLSNPTAYSYHNPTSGLAGAAACCGCDHMTCAELLLPPYGQWYHDRHPRCKTTTTTTTTTTEADCQQFACPDGKTNTDVVGGAYDEATCCKACADTPGWHDSYSKSQGCEHYKTNWCTRSFQLGNPTAYSYHNPTSGLAGAAACCGCDHMTCAELLLPPYGKWYADRHPRCKCATDVVCGAGTACDNGVCKAFSFTTSGAGSTIANVNDWGPVAGHLNKDGGEGGNPQYPYWEIGERWCDSKTLRLTRYGNSWYIDCCGCGGRLYKVDKSSDLPPTRGWKLDGGASPVPVVAVKAHQ